MAESDNLFQESELDTLRQRVSDLENQILGLNPRNASRSDEVFGKAVLTNIFGDGSDGDVVISSNTTLTRDMFYNTLIVNTGITLSTAGFRIFSKVSLVNNGTISVTGGNGGNGGTGLSGGAAGTAGTAPYSASSLPPPLAGAAGGEGGGGSSNPRRRANK